MVFLFSLIEHAPLVGDGADESALGDVLLFSNLVHWRAHVDVLGPRPLRSAIVEGRE